MHDLRVKTMNEDKTRVYPPECIRIITGVSGEGTWRHMISASWSPLYLGSIEPDERADINWSLLKSVPIQFSTTQIHNRWRIPAKSQEQGDWELSDETCKSTYPACSKIAEARSLAVRPFPSAKGWMSTRMKWALAARSTGWRFKNCEIRLLALLTVLWVIFVVKNVMSSLPQSHLRASFGISSWAFQGCVPTSQCNSKWNKLFEACNWNIMWTMTNFFSSLLNNSYYPAISLLSVMVWTASVRYPLPLVLFSFI